MKYIPDSAPRRFNSTAWESLARLLREAGYKKSDGKIETARKISRFMDPMENRSLSFQIFKEGLEAACK